VSTAAALRRTPLHDAHVAAGARLVPFAGFEMPVSYEGVRQEHLAVREAVGAFDVSHMGQIETEGPDATQLLQRLLTNDVARLEVGGAQYSCLCREDGGVLDDVFTYCVEQDRYLTVTNAANRERDFQWFADHAGGFDAEVRDAGDAYAMLAVQGPVARALVGRLADRELPPRLRVASARVAGVDALVCGTGYTGEDGVELLLEPDGARAVWDAVIAAGAAPAGLGARDTLRLEACFALYGNDLGLERTPIAAGLGWCCKEDTGFVGSDAVARERANDPPDKLAAFVLTGRGVPRPGNPAMRGIGIGMAYVAAYLAEPGTELEIDVRGTRRPARLERKPLYKKDRS
jgi:aminomethyltransferase